MKNMKLQEEVNQSFKMGGNSGIGSQSFVNSKRFTGGLDKADKKKSEYELAMEIEELKKQKNRDVDDIKILKVELAKLE